MKHCQQLLYTKGVAHLNIASFPGPNCFWLHRDAEDLVSFLTCVKSRVERLIECRCLGLRTARRARIPGNLPYECR